MAVSIKDVAKYAGVSIGTVSRAFNGYSDISQETKSKIFDSAQKLGYTPNVIARSLSSKVTSNIGLIVSGLLEGNSKDNLLYLVLQGIYRFTLENNLEVALYTTDSAIQRRKSYTQFCAERSIAGAILSGITTNDAYFKELIDTSFPCVTIDVQVSGNKIGSVSIDNFKAANEITQHLLELGHREILVISGKKNATVTVERIAGIYNALSAAGLGLARERVLYCDYSETLAYKKTKEYIQSNGNREVTAIVCLSDIMALGAMKAIRECGYSVPEDFSIVGFDGLPVTEYTNPPLTTVEQNMVEIGYEAASLLKEIIKNPEKARHVYLPHKLLIRQSTRRLDRTGPDNN